MIQELTKNTIAAGKERQSDMKILIFVDRNAHRFSHLFKKAEDLFSRLDHVKSRFIDWVALGAVDIEDYIMQTCVKADDWEANFRASKARGQVR